jgi:hypothetical protein
MGHSYVHISQNYSDKTIGQNIQAKHSDKTFEQNQTAYIYMGQRPSFCEEFSKLEYVRQKILQAAFQMLRRFKIANQVKYFH